MKRLEKLKLWFWKRFRKQKYLLTLSSKLAKKIDEVISQGTAPRDIAHSSPKYTGLFIHQGNFPFKPIPESFSKEENYLKSLNEYKIMKKMEEQSVIFNYPRKHGKSTMYKEILKQMDFVCKECKDKLQYDDLIDGKYCG